MYNPSRVSLKGTGVLTSSLSKTSDAISVNSIASFLDQNAATINRDYSYKGQYFKLHFPTELNLFINRRAFLTKNQPRFVEAMNNDLRHWLQEQVKEMQVIAASVIDRIVYDTEAEVVKLGARRNKPAEIREFRADYERTGQLREAVIQGVKFSGYQLTIGIDEKLAPYWIWVERGHRVVIGGRDTGNYVVGRPFIDAIYEALSDYVETNLIPAMFEYLDHIAYVTSEWVVGRTAAVQKLKFPITQ